MASAFVMCNFPFIILCHQKKKKKTPSWHFVMSLVQVHKCYIASMLYNLIPEGRNHLRVCCVCVSHSFVSDPLWPHGLQPARLVCPGNSPGKTTGVGCHFFLQEILPTQESKPGFPHCRQTLLAEPQAKPTESSICSLIHSLIKITLIKLCYC